MKHSKFFSAIICVALLGLVGFAGAPQSYAGSVRDSDADVGTQSTTPLTWNLASDFRAMPHQANPNPDRHGNAKVWYFMDSGSLARNPALYTLVKNYDPSFSFVPGLQGWEGNYPSDSDYLPAFYKNATGHTLSNPPPIPAGTFMVHPTPTTDAIVGWQSPIAGFVSIEGGVTDMSNTCGAGIKWFIDKGSTNLATGSIPNGGAEKFESGSGSYRLQYVHVTKGEFVYFAVDPGADYYCDGTKLDVTITQLTGRVWDLDTDFRVSPNQANPNPDRYGHAKIWYFMESATLVRKPATYTLVKNYDTLVQEVDGLQGWVGDYDAGGPHYHAPHFVKNTSNHAATPIAPFPPGAFFVHPTPTQDAIVGWKSPITGFVEVKGGVESIAVICGGGIKWFIDKKGVNLAYGSVARSASQAFEDGIGGYRLASVHVTTGDFIYFAVDPGADYYCDGTRLDVTIKRLDTTPPNTLE